MKTTDFREIKLGEIAPSPMNPRKGFTGDKFAELVASIKQKGVIEPIIIRPVKARGVPYEIVVGERRFRASCDADLETIPAIVRELTDDEAYDFMLVENLQREDLTEREEAASFKAYVGRHGKESEKDLAEKTGIRPGYIRSRVRVLELPAKVLKAWDDGKLVFGHLQQLLRLPDEEALEGMIKWVFQQLQWEHGLTVKDLARQIDEEAPAIGGAFFKAAESCQACPSNSAVQKELFGVETKGARCLNSKCFKNRQVEWLSANWKTTAIAKKAGTNSFRFEGDLDYSDFNRFGDYRGKPGKKCAGCENFISIIELSGKVEHEQACVGDKGCYRAITNPKSAKGRETGERDPEAPRATWHGEFFRDVFLSKRIPEVLAGVDPEDPKIKALLLVCAVHGNQSVLDTRNLSAGLLAKSTSELQKAFKAVVEKVVLSGQHVGTTEYNGFGTKGRQLVGKYLGIDLEKEFAVDADYLDKKTKAEIIAFGKKFKLFDKNVDVAKLKKSDLVKVVLAHGEKLVGLVPNEILKEAKKP